MVSAGIFANVSALDAAREGTWAVNAHAFSFEDIDGGLAGVWPSKVAPLDPEIAGAVEEALGARPGSAS